MKGIILQLPGAEEVGHISGDDGQRYTFAATDLKGSGVPSTGSQVDFAATEGKAVDIFFSPETPSRTAGSRQYEDRPSLRDLWFTLKGRAPRYDYWVRCVLIFIGIGLLAALLDSLFFGVQSIEKGESFFLMLVQILALWVSIIITIKRLRDMNRSPWLALLVVVPIANLVLWVMIAFVPGTVGPNKYGPDPLEA